MRSNGATSARVGELSLTLGPPIAPFAIQQPGPLPPDESDDPERRDLETLLASSGVDVDAILSAMRKKPAEVSE